MDTFVVVLLEGGCLRRSVSICNSNSAKMDLVVTDRDKGPVPFGNVSICNIWSRYCRLDVTDLDKLVGRAELPRPSSGKRKGRFLGMSQKSTLVP